MAKNFTSRGISAVFPRVFRAVIIKALPNSCRGTHVKLVKFTLSVGSGNSAEFPAGLLT